MYVYLQIVLRLKVTQYQVQCLQVENFRNPPSALKFHSFFFFTTFKPLLIISLNQEKWALFGGLLEDCTDFY